MKLKPGLKLLAETVGLGDLIARGDCASVRLRATLSRGVVVDVSHVEQVTLGQRRVIPGVEYALEGMRVGGIRKVRISPHLAYGDRGIERRIPPNATLIYDLELLELCNAG